MDTDRVGPTDGPASAAHASATSACRKVRHDVLILLVVALMAGLPTIFVPFAADQGFYACIGDTILHGGMPYRDAWDIKSPGLYYIYALAIAAFGHSEVAPRLLDLIAGALSAVILYAIGRRLAGRIAGLSAGATYLACYFGGNALQLGEDSGFLTLPIACALWLVVRSNSTTRAALGQTFVAGILAGSVLVLKIPYILIALAIAPFVAPGALGRRFAGMLLWCAGLAVIPALTWWYLCSQGIQHDLVEMLRYVAAYAHDGSRTESPLWQAVRTFIEFWGSIPLIAYGSLGAVLLAVSARDRRRLACAGWLVGAALAVVAQNKYFHYHFTILLAPTALAFGLWLKPTIDELRLPKSGSHGAIAVGIALLLSTLATLAMGHKDHFRLCIQGLRGGPAVMLAAADSNGVAAADIGKAAGYIADHTNADDTVFIFGAQPTIYFLARRKCPSRFIGIEPLLHEWSLPAWREELVRDLRRRPPVYFVLTHGDGHPGMPPWEAYLPQWPALYGWFQQAYALETSIGPIDLYRLKPTGGADARPGGLAKPPALPPVQPSPSPS
jgi:hypothetical protein